MDYKSPRMGSNQRHMAYKAKYVLSTALAFKIVRQQAARVLNYTSELVTGIEPATFGTGNRRSNHCEAILTYGTHFCKGKAIVEKTKTKRSNHQILSYDDELIHEERLFYGTYPIRIKNMRCYIRHECIMASLAIMPCKLPACHRTYPRPVMRPMAGISPCHYSSLRHLMTLSAKEFTSTAIAYIILKGGMLQAQGDFWNNPTGVIRNRNPAPFRFKRRSNPSLRQSPPISSNLSKNAWLSAAKI